MSKFKSLTRFITAAFFLSIGGLTILLGRKNLKPVYRGLKYFLEHESYQITLQTLMSDPKTKELIETRYQANAEVNWNLLKSLPEKTLGHEFAKFMNNPDVTPIDKLPENGSNISPEIDYLRQRIRLIHDIHHVVCAYPADELGEMGISAFYVAQINSPLNSVLLGLGLIKCTIKYPKRLPELMDAISEGWMLGKKSPNLFGIKWEEMWSLPVSEVRQHLGLQTSALGKAMA
jgi:ubiquinone biosynthesis protein Coq4